MKSIKVRFNLAIIIIIISVICAALINIYLNTVGESLDEKLHEIMRLEKNFFSTLVQEDSALTNPSQYDEFMVKFQKLKAEFRKINIVQYNNLLNQRENLVKKLHGTDEDSSKLLLNVNEILRKLIDSTRYIHSHHIAYLKNMMRRGKIIEDYDNGEEFKRSPVKAASEPDAIKAAIEIQTSLLDIFKIFYDLQRNFSPSGLKIRFASKIKEFFKLANSFEDYSLDAQDGILVEELLMNGRIFEKSFFKLIANEQSKKNLLRQLYLNKKKLLSDLSSLSNNLSSSFQKSRNKIKALQIITIFTMVVMLMVALFYGRDIINGFQHTVKETRKIRRNLTYQIDIKKSNYYEFNAIFKALNEMAQTIHNQVSRLEDAQNLLTKTVEERTSELMTANKNLENEMHERIRSEKAKTELERKLSRAKKMEAIGTLAGGVAHDLNNILAGLINYPELLLLDLDRESPLRKPLLTIKSSGEKAAAIVQDLLTLARRGVTVSEIVDINHVVREYLKSPEFRDLSVYNPGVRVETRLEAELCDIMGSGLHLSKTIMNLVSNASEAMPDGGRLVISTRNQYVDTSISGYDDVKEGDYVVLSVSDDGIGISKEDIEKIFEPFYSKKKMGRSGTGLGMAVVWGTVKDHNGYIDIKSAEGRGTTITIFFPLCREKRISLLPDALSIADLTGSGESVLIVDDIEEQRDIASRMLKKLGYSAFAVESGEKAVEYLRNKPVDLLVLDMIMAPGMDGLDTYKEILTINHSQKSIITSGFSETDRVMEALSLGAGAYLRKPYTIEKLGSAVKTELDTLGTPPKNL